MALDSIWQIPIQLLAGDTISSRDCNHYDSYAPYVPHHTPLKYVHVNVHMVYKGDTTATPDTSIWNKLQVDSIKYGNLFSAHLPNTSVRTWVKNSFEQVNSNAINMDNIWGVGDVYVNLDTSKIQPVITPYIQDSRIRFIVDTILFYFDDSLYTIGNPLDYYNSTQKSFLDNYFNDTISNTIGINPYNINVILLGNPGNGYADGIGGGTYNKAFSSGFLTKLGHEDPALIRHEVGHLLGLDHPSFIRFNSSGIPIDTLYDRLDDTHSIDPVTSPLDPNCYSGSACSNNMMSYNDAEDALTAWQIGCIHAYLMNKEGGNIWRALDPHHCTYQAAEKISIDSGEIYTWKGEKWLKGDLVIRKGGSLTIQCKVAFPKDARVIVEGGGKLTLDGGTLTNICNDLWKGVYVLGNHTRPQSDTLAQGRIILKNGSVIEQAHNAVTLVDWDSNGPKWTTTGGIIQADSSYFLNNVRAIAFMSYQNKVGNLELNNASSITSCRFETNQALKNGRVPYAFITMFDVKNVKLRSNHFINTHYPQTQAGMGIYTEYTTLRVDAPGINGPNIFENLECGIRVNEFNSAHQTVIKNAKFINNYGGIHLMNTAYAVVTEDSFAIMGYDSTMTAPCGTPDGYRNTYGIHLAHSDRYKVEANDFTTYDSLITSGYPDAFDNQTGIIVSNSGTGGNQIYRNTFHDLIVGNKAQGVNGLPLSQVGVGLEYKCNNFSGEIFKAAIGVTPKGRIAYRQGSLDFANPSNSRNPAGNEFDQTTSRTPLDTMMDIWYNEPDHIIYTHHLDSFCIPRKVQMGSVILSPSLSYKDSLSCPSNLISVITGGGGSARSANPVSEYIALIESAKALLDSIEAGGQHSLKDIIQNEAPADAWLLLDPFMPLLSDKILNEVAYKAMDTLAPEYFNILIQHSPLSEYVWENMASISFDSAQAAELMAAQEASWSARDSAYFRASDWVMARDLFRNDEIRWWLEDEEDSSRVENIMTFLQLCPTLESRLHLTDWYIKLGMWEEAGSLLDSIEIVEDYAWLPYVRIQESILSAYTRAGSLKTKTGDADLLESLETDIANDVYGKGKLIALNNIISGNPPCPEAFALIINEDGPPAERRGLVPFQDDKSFTNQLKVYPNPTKGIVNILLDTKEKVTGILIIRDLQGKIILENDKFNSGEIEVVPISKLPTGMYLLELRTENKAYFCKLIKE